MARKLPGLKRELDARALFSVAYAELRHYDDAQDAVAAALLRLCRSVRQMRSPERAKAWIDTIVRNEARRVGAERGRRQSRETDLENREIFLVGGDFTDTLRLDIERALRTLPYNQARAAALYYLEGNSVAQVAGKLERPAGTIKYWLHLGRVHLAHEMKEYDPAMKTETTPAFPLPSVAVIASDENDETLRNWETALKAAGWDEVRIEHDFAALVRVENSPLEGAQYLVLDHRIGGRSAFEAWPILKSRASSKTLISLLLLETKEDPVYEALVLSAYVSGFDFCLTKPLNLAELESFARQARERQDAVPAS